MKPINRKILVVGIAIILTGSVLFVLSADIRSRKDSPYDMIVATVQGVDFQINKLAFGGNTEQDISTKGLTYNPDSRFVFSHVIAEIDHPIYDTSYSEVLVSNILEGRDIYFNLVITIYSSCTPTYTDCTVTSELTFPEAFIAGYHFILNDGDPSGFNYDFIEVFEFGFNQFTIKSPNTTQDVPNLAKSSYTTTSTSSTGSHNVRQYTSFYSFNWYVELNTGIITKINVSAIQFSIIAEMRQSGLDERPKDGSGTDVYPGRYMLSDVYFEKDVLNEDTVTLVDILNTGKILDANVGISFCDTLGDCELETRLELTGSKITSLFSYLEDTIYDDQITSTEVFSLSAGHFNIVYQP